MDWGKIRKEYEQSSITLKELATKHDIKIGTLKSRKSREQWASRKVATNKKKDATNRIRDATPKVVIKNDNLNDKQKLFCLYYIKYFNATKAYMKAYQVDRNTAESIAYRLMAHVGVKGEITRLKAERQASIFVEAVDVLQKYIDIAFSDMSDYMDFGQKEVTVDYNSDGEPIMTNVNYVDFKNATDVDATIISEVKQGKDGVSIKLHDKMKALDKLEQYTNMLSESQRDRLQQEKIIAETMFIEERTKLIKGTKKDTALMDALIDVSKGDES